MIPFLGLFSNEQFTIAKYVAMYVYNYCKQLRKYMHVKGLLLLGH